MSAAGPGPQGVPSSPAPPPASAAAVRRAFVLGAGLGTRLRPLTDNLPKPLVPVFQKRLVTFAFDHLLSAGVREIIVNTHHAARHWDRLFPGGAYRGARLVFIHEPVLLETGGGIRNAAPLLCGEAFFVYNGDTLTDLPLQKLAEEQARTGADAVLALRSGGGPLRVAWDPESGAVRDLAGLANSGLEPRFLFTGHYLATPVIHNFLEPGRVESVIPALIRMIQAGCRVSGVLCDEGGWFDLGSRAAYFEAHRRLAADPAFPRHGFSGQEWRQAVHPSARVAADARLEGLVVIGENASVSTRACLKNSILFPGARVGPGVILENCIVGEGREVPGGGLWTETDF